MFGCVVNLKTTMVVPVVFAVLKMYVNVGLPGTLGDNLLININFINLSMIATLLADDLNPTLDGVIRVCKLRLKVFSVK